MNIQMLFRTDVEDWLGETYYFDYASDISYWYISERAGSIRFNEMTTAEVIGYMSNITSPTLAVMKIIIGGAFNTYTYTSTINCTGFTNSTPVETLSFSQIKFVF